jgi:hypothetical protein
LDAEIALQVTSGITKGVAYTPIQSIVPAVSGEVTTP